MLWLAGRIIDASNPQEPVDAWFPGDDLFAPSQRRRGLPIGNQTSQFWANLYLHPLDLFIKQELGCRAYVRYCDDLLLFGDDKATLHRWRGAAIDFAATLRLTLHAGRAQSSRGCAER